MRFFLDAFGMETGVHYPPDSIYFACSAARSSASEHSEKLYCHRSDVQTAFLTAEISDEFHMKQPHGSYEGSDRVSRVVRALCGTKQAAFEFNQKIESS